MNHNLLLIKENPNFLKNRIDTLGSSYDVIHSFSGWKGAVMTHNPDLDAQVEKFLEDTQLTGYELNSWVMMDPQATLIPAFFITTAHSSDLEVFTVEKPYVAYISSPEKSDVIDGPFLGALTGFQVLLESIINGEPGDYYFIINGISVILKIDDESRLASYKIPRQRNFSSEFLMEIANLFNNKTFYK